MLLKKTRSNLDRVFFKNKYIKQQMFDRASSDSAFAFNDQKFE